MEDFGVSPFRTPQSLARTHAIRIQAIRRSARGSQVLGVDVKVLIFAFAHITILASLIACNTRLAVILRAALRLESFGDVVYAATAWSLVLMTVFLYASVYASDPGWVEPENSNHSKRIPSIHLTIAEDANASKGPCEPLPCQYCGARPPLRSRHCLQTGQCVVKFDHYCHLLSTAIGDLNHARYYLYILCELILSAWALQIVLQQTIGRCTSAWRDGGEHQQYHLNGSCWDAVGAAGTGVFLMLLGCLLVAFIGLFGYLVALHTYLICTGQTTYEVVKGPRVPYLTMYFQPAGDDTQQGNSVACNESRRRYRLPQDFPRLIYAHFIAGKGPPAPFSAGLSRNLCLFWRLRPCQPHPYSLQFQTPNLSETAAARWQQQAGDKDTVNLLLQQTVPENYRQAIDVQYSQGEV